MRYGSEQVRETMYWVKPLNGRNAAVTTTMNPIEGRELL